MKKIILILLTVFPCIITFAQTVDLNGVTFGFGAGYSASMDKTYDYTLTTDIKHKLNIQPLNKGAFVISSVVMVKLGKATYSQDNSAFVGKTFAAKRKAFDSHNAKAKSLAFSYGEEDNDYKAEKAALDRSKADLDDASKPNLLSRFSVNASLNLINISQNVTFNKNIDGGLGVGFFLTPDIQLAGFYDVSSVSELRDYVVKNYEGKSIPNGDKTFYTSLDPKDTNLFYNKVVSGFSIKLVFSLANTKGQTSTE